MNTTQQIQQILGANPDGIWGPKTQQLLNTAIRATANGSDTIRRIQTALGVEADGRWGVVSQTALNALLGDGTVFRCEASSFADPADVRAFVRCKATGKTDLQCFAVGDNGIGQFGKITAQDKVPMIAVHRDAMVARWGSVIGAAHRPVEITVGKKTITATVEDRISARGRIDLNPACARLLGLKPPFVVPCQWRWL